MEQIVLDACKLIGIDPQTVVESSIRVNDSEVIFVADFGIKGSPKLRFSRSADGSLTYVRSLGAFLDIEPIALPQSEPVVVPQAPAVPTATVNVGFAETQQATPQRLAWTERRKKTAKEN